VLIASLPDVVTRRRARRSTASTRCFPTRTSPPCRRRSEHRARDRRASRPRSPTRARHSTSWRGRDRDADGHVLARELGGTGGENIKAAALKLRAAADSVANSAARLDRMVGDNAENIDRFAGDGLAEFEQLMRETREAMQSFDALTKSLEKDPSRVIYRPAPAGVEIPP
jgi:hypothetical protein